MSLKVGIVGLPNVGKSTLFNALLKKRVALSANYPFATIEPNVGVVAVPDARLNELAELVKNEEKMMSLPPLVPAVVEFVDIAGLVKGASTGAGLGNQFLSHVREGSVSPEEDKSIIETELGLSDLQVLEKLIIGQEKLAKTSKDPLESKKIEILNSVKKNLEEGKILGHYEMGDERLEVWFKALPLLTIKPHLYVYNVLEKDYSTKLCDRQILESELVICAKIEEDLADCNEEERREYLESLGIMETGLERLIKKAYSLLGLISYLTAGQKEVRAWTIKKGTKAPQAAGVIHTDFEKNFIRAQVINYNELLVHGSWSKAKEAGKIRTEGKDYIVQDGDVIEFLVGS